MVDWCKKYAVALALIAGVLVVVGAIQAVMLYWSGWRIQLGSLADWLQAVGTVAAFGALFYAAQEWRSAQADRRAREARQASLIIVEPEEEPVIGGFPGQTQDGRYIVVRNRSDAPIFNVQVDHLDGAGRFTVEQELFGRGRDGREPALFPVLQPNRSTEGMTIAWKSQDKATKAAMEYISFTFTDSDGVEWRRVGSGKPTRLRES